MIEDICRRLTETIPLTFFKAGLTVVAAWIIAKILQKLLDTYVKPKTYSPALIDLMGNTLKNIILTLAALSALGTLGVNVQGLMAGFGLTGFAVGFALKDTLANIIAGIFILLYRPFKIGQYIKVATSKSLSDEGFVEKIDLRYTTLDNTNETVLVPNSVLFTNSIAIFKKPPAA
jgi:small conductance mechanosensitive channel